MNFSKFFNHDGSFKDVLFNVDFRNHSAICHTKKMICVKHPATRNHHNDNCRNKIIKYLKDEGYLDKCDDKVILFDFYTETINENIDPEEML